jgi:hypothetical protein
MSEDGILSFLPAEVWPALAGRLWHATHIDKALAILADGRIRPDAPAKYKTGYCRSLGGVSLFDFRQPDEHAADAFSRGAGHWLSGHHAEDQDEIGVWFEIDPARAPPHILSTEIFKHWQDTRAEDESGMPRPRDPMPYCEACHRGAISLAAVAGALLIDARRPADHERVPADEDLAAVICDFRSRVRAKPPLPRGLADLLREARTKLRDENP